jgi:hypothetical protein
MYYRYQTTNYPTLPNRIRLNDGSTRTSLDEYSYAELMAFGIEFIEGNYPAPPVAPVPLTHKQFMDKFTDSELAAIMTAAKSSIELELWFKRFEMAQDILLNDPQTISGVNALETAGLIATGRASEILNG